MGNVLAREQVSCCWGEPGMWRWWWELLMAVALELATTPQLCVLGKLLLMGRSCVTAITNEEAGALLST